MVSNGLILSFQMRTSLVNKLSDDLARNGGVYVAIQSTVFSTVKHINLAKHKSESS